MSGETRLKIEAEQEEFVRALFGKAPAPLQIDADRFETASLVLKKKRMKGVKKSWPKLVGKLGCNFKEYFAEYARQKNQPKYQASLLDGRLFAQFLEGRDLLPEEVKPEIERFDLNFMVRKNRLCRRGKLKRIFYKISILVGK